ncbi:MAG: hypothetical protein SGARI_003538, partial [Bacillariaceae sp.]
MGSIDWNKSILSILGSSSNSKSKSKTDNEAQKVKKVRKLVLMSLQMDESDKAAKKQFKKAIQAMEQDGTLQLDADGHITLLKKAKKKDKEEKKKRKLSKEEKKGKKKKKQKTEEANEAADDGDSISPEKEAEDERDGDDEKDEHDDHSAPASNNTNDDKNKPCKGNPQGITRLFLGNLPFAVDESSLAAFLPGEVTHVKWITDKETGKFYGSAFIEMKNSIYAADAVALAGSKLIGRPIKINFAPAREGDVWPPAKKVVSGGSSGGGGGGQAGGSGIKAMSAKPDNCMKLFIGNLSYDIGERC